MNNNNQYSAAKNAKKIFLDKGTCSHAFFHILNQEFGRLKPDEEMAADVLAGGILRQGYQCGMLWGATMAVGAEAFRREPNSEHAIASAVTASQHLVASFVKRANSIECSDITETDMGNNLKVVKYLITGKARVCFNLAGNWAPEAIEAAKNGLSEQTGPSKTLSCAAETVKKMGATDEEAVIVAGLAGGIGLSGNGCGALAAAVWLKSLRLIQKQNKKPGMKNPDAEKILKAFQSETQYEMECKKITGRIFKSPQEHTDFIKNGGCEKIIQVLSST